MTQYLFNGPQQAGDVSLSFLGSSIQQISVEAAAVGAQGVAVSGVVVVEGSNTGNDWIPIMQLTITGTTRGADGGIAQTNWQYLRGRIVSVSANTQIVCAMNSKGFPYGT